MTQISTHHSSSYATSPASDNGQAKQSADLQKNKSSVTEAFVKSAPHQQFMPMPLPSPGMKLMEGVWLDQVHLKARLGAIYPENHNSDITGNGSVKNDVLEDITLKDSSYNDLRLISYLHCAIDHLKHNPDFNFKNYDLDFIFRKIEPNQQIALEWHQDSGDGFNPYDWTVLIYDTSHCGDQKGTLEIAKLNHNLFEQQPELDVDLMPEGLLIQESVRIQPENGNLVSFNNPYLVHKAHHHNGGSRYLLGIVCQGHLHETDIFDVF